MKTTGATAPLALSGLNRSAPAISASTMDWPRSRSDDNGRWLVPFSHPADFTPACTTGFIVFARHHEQFKAAGRELLGLPIARSFAHVAWTRCTV